MNILVTGGAGYIGSHATLRLLEDGHAVTVIDDLTRGHREVMDILEPLGDLEFVEADVGDRDTVVDVLRGRSIDLVMHFGAVAYVGESMNKPLWYFRKNTAGSLGLLEAMEAADVRRLIFSSTCATYGEPPADQIPIVETNPQVPINPYGASKLFVERMILDYAAQRAAEGTPIAAAMLRYFNVAGSDPKGRIGEDHDPETHLIPICLQVALGQREQISIFGTDYPTPDGTCVRDYVHVSDLVDAHVAMIDALEPGSIRRYNIGIGRGYSVREIIDAARRVTGVDFAAVEAERRPGDPPSLYCDPQAIRDELGWTAQHTDLDEIIRTAWAWMRDHPEGYRS